MVNYTVKDLSAVQVALRRAGCEVADKTEESEFGEFGWVMDPVGNRIELWEPPGGGIGLAHLIHHPAYRKGDRPRVQSVS